MASRTIRPAKRRASRTRKAEPVQAQPAPPAYARGNPLTHTVNFTDDSGQPWLVYLEPCPATPSLWPNAAVIPGRRIRFDSHELSLAVTPVPAGAPFLSADRLKALFEAATPIGDPPPPAPVPPRPAAEPGSIKAAEIQAEIDTWRDRALRFAAPALGLALVFRDLVLPRRS